MDKQAFTQPLIAVGVLVLVGTVGAQIYYTHEPARRVAATEAQAPMGSTPTPTAGQWDPWIDLQAAMMRMQDRMDRMLDNGFQSTFAMPRVALQPGGSKVTLDDQDGSYPKGISRPRRSRVRRSAFEAR